MGYVGNQQTEGFSSIPAKQDLTGASGTSLTLSHAVASAEGIDLFINNVRQEPTTAYSVTGTAVTLTGSVVATDDIYVVYNSLALQTTVPPDASVSTAKIIDGSVTAAKLASGAADVAGITTASTSGTAMSIDSSNRILTPARPAFSARGSGSWVDVADGATDVIAMTVADINVGSCYSTSSYEFTAPVAGLYQLQCIVYIRNNGGSASDSGTYGYVKLQKNGSSVAGFEAIHGYLNLGDADQTDTLSGLIQLAVNDTVRLVMQSAGGGTSSYNRNNTSFSGYLVG